MTREEKIATIAIEIDRQIAEQGGSTDNGYDGDLLLLVAEGQTPTINIEKLLEVIETQL